MRSVLLGCRIARPDIKVFKWPDPSAVPGPYFAPERRANSVRLHMSEVIHENALKARLKKSRADPGSVSLFIVVLCLALFSIGVVLCCESAGADPLRCWVSLRL
jgi:hypothetical protein